MEYRIPLLLTSSIIAHDQGVKLKDTDARLRHAIESVEQWLRIDPRLPIVLCDGSNFDLQAALSDRFADVTIECLRFENDQEMVRKFGRGYGEGEIVRYALSHSRLIEQAGCFAKCSSKLWVENFDECKSWWNGDFLCKGVFLDVFSPFKATVFHHIDTRFYFASKSFYERHLLDAHNDINVATGYGLEECFHDILLREQMQGVLLPVPPVIAGVGGGTANYYRNSRKRVWKERLRVKLVQREASFRSLFADRGPVKIGAASSETAPSCGL